MAYNLDTAMTMRQYQKGHRRLQADIANLGEAIDNKISSVYKVKGSLPFASLTSALLVKANEGNVYNITDAFTSTADFVKGAGKKYSASSNVVVVDTTTAVFTVSTDNTVDAGKTYYIHQNGGYSAVTPAQAQTLLQGEIDALAESRMDSTLNIADETEIRRRELAREEQCRITTDDALQKQINTLSESVLEILAIISEKRERQTGGN